MNNCSVPKNEGVLACPRTRRDFLEKGAKNCCSGLGVEPGVGGWSSCPFPSETSPQCNIASCQRSAQSSTAVSTCPSGPEFLLSYLLPHQPEAGVGGGMRSNNLMSTASATVIITVLWQLRPLT